MLTGCIVTVDAIGRQPPIAAQLVGHPAPNLLRRERTLTVRVRVKRLSFGWDETFLLTVLAA